MKSLQKILVANRGEIAIRVFRASTELGIPTASIYAFEDRFSLHRYKADESFQVGKEGAPVASYLNIEAIIEVAKAAGVDAIHPGYGFLSERAAFRKAVEEAGIQFIGPSLETLEIAGDKVKTRNLAKTEGVPIIEGTEALESVTDAKKAAKKIGYPIMLKSSFGGGGRGMRVVRNESELVADYEEASKEALAAFGRAEIFIENYVENPKHLEVQLLGDGNGNVVHLHERDCSVQRRHQKVVEVAPAISLPERTRQQLFDYALKLGNALNLKSAATCEFLLSEDGKLFFIEINPRIQVEHTVTEEVTGIDIVQSQIRIAQGESLKDLGLSQNEISTRGVAIQCRITTENPSNNFQPDYGTLVTYRSASGHGIRLDAGSAFTGAEVLPFYDSLLVKVTARGKDQADAASKLSRALVEFRVRGVNTNIPFLYNLIAREEFLQGQCRTGFIEDNPDLFIFQRRRNRANRVLQFLGEVTVNGHELMPNLSRPAKIETPEIPQTESYTASGLRDVLLKEGKKAFLNKIKTENSLLVTDTTFRDAHQSLLATRVRSYDLLNIAPIVSQIGEKFFSLEMWGGATFDVAYRFLQEDPWQRLDVLREAIPNIPFQMLLRGSNAVGYSRYPTNVITNFVEEAHKRGIDVFRIFDCLNSLEKMRVSIDKVQEVGAIAEVSICYTGDLASEEKLSDKGKFNLEYYQNLARNIEEAGADMIAIKDMAGLLRAPSARILVEGLKQASSLPIHLHTHDTAGGQIATYLEAAEAGVDVVDCAFSSLSGVTSQPSLEGLVRMMENSERETLIETSRLTSVSAYWEKVREYYQPFESDLITSTSEVYENEIPGGQYSNLRPQAESLGLGDKLKEVKQAYIEVNELFGRIVKVTPSSKVVGDLALFMVANDISIEELKEQAGSLSLPDSVVGFLKGELGTPHGGFPAEFRKAVLGEGAVDFKPEPLADADFESAKKEITSFSERPVELSDVLSYLLYPRVFKTYSEKRELYGDVSVVPTVPFLYGLIEGEEIAVALEAGKILYIKLISITEPNELGERSVIFELNGQARSIVVKDQSVASAVEEAEKADPENPNHISAPLTGVLIEISVKEGQAVKAGDLLFTLEAMKMQTQVTAPNDGTVKRISLKEGRRLEGGDLVIELT